MLRKSEPIEVRTTDEGMIHISQPGFGGEDSLVVVHPDQVELVIAWLKEAKAELAGQAVETPL